MCSFRYIDYIGRIILLSVILFVIIAFILNLIDPKYNDIYVYSLFGLQYLFLLSLGYLNYIIYSVKCESILSTLERAPSVQP